MMDDRNVSIITDAEGKRFVLINDIRFKGKRHIDWDEVETYLKGYVGNYYEISDTAEKIYIGNELPKEFTGSDNRIKLQGMLAKAKANSATAIPELISIATNPNWEANKKEKHTKMAKNGWYRYDIRFALPVYVNENLGGYNLYKGQLLVNHAENGKRYLYDVLGIKKETSNPQQ